MIIASVETVQDTSFQINSAIQQGGNWGATVSTSMIAFMMFVSLITWLIWK